MCECLHSHDTVSIIIFKNGYCNLFQAADKIKFIIFNKIIKCTKVYVCTTIDNRMLLYITIIMISKQSKRILNMSKYNLTITNMLYRKKKQQ